jgi:hypothetical protein
MIPLTKLNLYLTGHFYAMIFSVMFRNAFTMLKFLIHIPMTIYIDASNFACVYECG